MSYQLPEWSKEDDLGGVVPSQVRVALGDAYRQGMKDAALSEPEAEPFGYVIRGRFYFNREHAESHKRNLAPLADIVPVYTHTKADADRRDGCALDVRADLPMTLARSIGFLEGQIYALQNYVIVDDRPELKDVLKLLQVELESLRKEPK